MAPEILTYSPAVVVHISPFTGDEGAAPCPSLILDTPVVPAAKFKQVVDDAAIPIELLAVPSAIKAPDAIYSAALVAPSVGALAR